MKIRIDRYAPVLAFYVFFLFSKIQTRFATPLYDDNLVIVIYALGMLLILISSGANKYINKRVGMLLVILIVYVLLYNVFFRNDYISSYIISYSIAYLGFTIAVFSTAIYFSYIGKMYNLMVISFWVLSLTIAIMYILNFDNFATLKNLSTAIFMAKRNRSNFGFTHANTTASIALTGMLLWLLLYAVDRKNDIKRGNATAPIYIIAMLFDAFILISSVSKGTILAAAFGICVYVYYCNGKDHRNSVKIKTFFGIIFVLLLLAIAYTTLVETGILEIEYRLKNFTVNIPTLINSGRTLTGWGFVDKAVFSNGRIISGTEYTDNFYLYIFVSTGVVGCVIMLTFLVYMLLGIQKSLGMHNGERSLHIKSVIWSFIATDLVLCMTQASFYHPASVFSFITMLVYLACIIQKDNFLVDKGVWR